MSEGARRVVSVRAFSSPLGAETCGLVSLDQPGLQSEFQDSQSYRERKTLFEKDKTKQKKDDGDILIGC